MTTQTFEEAVAEFLSRSKEQIDQESDENLPPWMPAPYDQGGPPYEYSQRFTSDFITRYALSIGDNNPIFTDPEYGKTTRYGCQIAPGPAMALVRYPSVHGAVRPGGYPACQLHFRRGVGVLRRRPGRDEVPLLQGDKGDIRKAGIPGQPGLLHLGQPLLGLPRRSPGQVLRHTDIRADVQHGKQPLHAGGTAGRADAVRTEDVSVQQRADRRCAHRDQERAAARRGDALLGGRGRGRYRRPRDICRRGRCWTRSAITR